MEESRRFFLALGLLLLGVVDWCPRSSFNDTFLFPSSTVPSNKNTQTRSYILVLGDPASSSILRSGSTSSGHHSAHRHLLPIPSTKAPKKATDYEDEDYDLEELDEEDEDPDDTEDLFNEIHKLSVKNSSTAAPPTPQFGEPPMGIPRSSNNKCPPELYGKCSCKTQIDPRDKRHYRYVVNCTRAGFTNADYLKFIPDQTEVLIVRGNKMPILPKNIFGQGRNLTQLKEIDLSSNEIEEVHGKTFHGVSTVEILILSQNKIDTNSILGHPRLLSSFHNLKSLHLDSAFAEDTSSEHLLPALVELFDQSNLTLLNKLHLEGNSIERIPDQNTFCSLPSLEQLYLSDNHLTDLFLNASCFSPGLYYIDLSSNRIKVVRSPSFLLDSLEKVPRNPNVDPPALRIDLHDNPFDCDCNLQGFLNWLTKVEYTDPDRVRYHEDMRCATGLPKNNTGKMLISVHHTICPSPLSAEANDVMNAVSKGLLGVITLGLLAMIVGLLIWKGKGLRYLFGPTQIGGTSLLSGGSGVKYTTVEDEEACAEVAHV